MRDINPQKITDAIEILKSAHWHTINRSNEGSLAAELLRDAVQILSDAGLSDLELKDPSIRAQKRVRDAVLQAAKVLNTEDPFMLAAVLMATTSAITASMFDKNRLSIRYADETARIMFEDLRKMLREDFSERLKFEESRG